MDFDRGGQHRVLRLYDVTLDVRLSGSLDHRHDYEARSGIRIERRTQCRPDGDDCLVVG
jgi:hypothetical protein